MKLKQTLVLGLLLAAVLVVPGSTNAQSSAEDLKVQIVRLQAQLAELSGQIPTPTLPPGCISPNGYSSTTGLPCSSVILNGPLPIGCTSPLGFSPITGLPCSGGTPLPPGCTSIIGFSTTTGLPCSSGSTGTTTPSMIPMTVIYPNGGEILPIGSTKRIKWDPQGMPPDDGNTMVGFILMDTRQVNPTSYILDGLTNYLLENRLNHRGWVDWVVGQGVTPQLPTGRYKMRITCIRLDSDSDQDCYRSPNGSIISEDWSDSMFDVVAGTTTLAATVDLKINRSDGPLTVAEGEIVTASYVVPTSVSQTCFLNSTSDTWSISFSASGSYQIPIRFSGAAGGKIYLRCESVLGTLLDKVILTNSGAVTTIPVPTVAVTGKVFSEYGVSNAGDYSKRIAASFKLTPSGGTIYVAKNSNISLVTNTNAVSFSLPHLDFSPCSNCADTSSYLAIPSGVTRELSYTGEISNLGGTEGVKSASVDKIYWSNNSNNLQKFSITSGLESLRNNIFLGAGNIPTPAAAITSFNPPNGAIDARRTGGDEFRNVELTFSSPLDLTHSFFDYFGVSSSIVGGAPAVSQVRWGYADSVGSHYSLSLSRDMISGEHIRITYRPSNTSICLGYLPGDVDGSGMVAAADQLALIDVLNGVKTLPIYATDIDRNGVVNPADILALVDGFNSGWMGKTLSACPSPVGISPTNAQLSSMASAIEAIGRAIEALRLNHGF